MSIIERAHRDVNVKEFHDTGIPDDLGNLPLTCPIDDQYILRMAVRAEGGEYHIPDDLAWVEPMFRAALAHQSKISDHPFCYITVRHGEVVSRTDDEWHVDGFSTKIAHTPEQNYIWCDRVGTEYAPLSVMVPDDFDPLRHNINAFLAPHIKDVRSCEAGRVYCMDPYIVHRRPSSTNNSKRTFVRISFVPIEINDINNTQNPLLPRQYSHDGVEFRNSLGIYGVER